MAAPAAPGSARAGPGPAELQVGAAALGLRQRLARDARAAGPPFPLMIGFLGPSWPRALGRGGVALQAKTRRPAAATGCWRHNLKAA